MGATYKPGSPGASLDSRSGVGAGLMLGWDERLGL